MRAELDLHGQPLPEFNASRRAGRGLDAMLGICQGVLADGVVTAEEAGFLHSWMSANPDVTRSWPGDVMAARLERIYADAVVDNEERAELNTLLRGLLGGRIGVAAEMNLSTALPIDDPAPTLTFPGQTYVFTGLCAYGPRKACQAEVEVRGGLCASGITKRTNVVVIGTFASRDWLHTNHGTKILKAVEYRDRGVPIAIVGENHWAAHII